MLPAQSNQSVLKTYQSLGGDSEGEGGGNEELGG